MTRHLRFYFLTLLSMVCVCASAAVGDVYRLVTSVSELHAGDVVVIANTQYNSALGFEIYDGGNHTYDDLRGVGITINNNRFAMVDGVAELTLEKDDKGWYFVTEDGRYLYSTFTLKLEYFSSKNETYAATISIDESGDHNAYIDFLKRETSFYVMYDSPYSYFTNWYYNEVDNETHRVQIYKRLTYTNLKLSNLSGTGVVLTDGKTHTQSLFTGYKAYETNSVPGTITYTATGDDIATVDASTGAVTVNPNVYGTMTVTATFTPDDTDNYQTTSASYTITNVTYPNYENIATLRADLDNGTLTPSNYRYIYLDLTNAKVVYKKQWTSDDTSHELYFIREGEGDNAAAVCLYNPGITLQDNCLVTGSYSGFVCNYNGMLCLTQNEETADNELTITPSSDEAEPIEVTTDNVASHVCDLVNVKDATVTQGVLSDGGTSAVAKIYNNYFSVDAPGLAVPYTGANVDVNSAIVIPSLGTDGTTLAAYYLAPTRGNSVVYNFSESNTATTLAAQANVPVALKRTFAKGEWNTLCLPFALNSVQLTSMFGSDVQVRTLSAVEGNTLTFKEATELAAEQPCLIKLGAIADDNTYTATGVSIVAHTDGANKCAPTADATSMVGVYQLTDATKEATGTALFLGDGNKFYQAKAGSQMKGFRAYFDMPKGGDMNKVQAVIDGETTGIDALNGDVVKQNGRVYNLNGQCVGTSLEQLQRGVYIQNGKKVVVK